MRRTTRLTRTVACASAPAPRSRRRGTLSFHGVLFTPDLHGICGEIDSRPVSLLVPTD